MNPSGVQAGRRVTGVRRSKRDAAVIVVMLEGVRAGEVEACEAERLGIARGATLDDGMAEGLRAALASCAARRDATRLARARPRTKAEIVRRLTERGHDSTIAAAAADRLAEAGAINERSVAEVAALGMSERRISRRLAQDRLVRRGIDDEQAASAVQAAFGEQDDLDRAVEAARRRAASLWGLQPAAAQRRLAAYLARRGYDEETCLDALRVVLGEQE